MIVRIMGEGQLDLPDTALDGLNALDHVAELAVESGDQSAFTEALAALLAAVRAQGIAVPVSVLTPSDLVLPPADVSLEEVRHLFDEAAGGDGLVPGRVELVGPVTPTVTPS